MALVGTPQALAGMLKSRLMAAPRIGPPKGLSGLRVSATRHGVTGTNLRGEPTTIVRSPMLAGPDPPPDTLTWFVNWDDASDATFTVTMIAGELVPPASALLRVQLLAAVPGHVHPVPLIDTSVRSEGTDSVTVTVPLVGPAPAAFDTVTLYIAPFCPWVKLPLCVFVMLRSEENT